MKIENIKSPEDILEYMKENIKYGWLDINNEEHMHCFVLYYLNNKVYQIEHPNWMRIGIYEFASEEAAIKEINDYYIEMAEGMPRPLAEYYEVTPNISFKEFNNYINSLDEKIII